MLVRVAAVRQGETVLVHAAAGGVGLAIAELRRILRFRVLGLASASKHAVLREDGVEPPDSQDPRWFSAVRAAPPRGRVAGARDGVGGGAWPRRGRAPRPGGR